MSISNASVRLIKSAHSDIASPAFSVLNLENMAKDHPNHATVPQTPWISQNRSWNHGLPKTFSTTCFLKPTSVGVQQNAGHIATKLLWSPPDTFPSSPVRLQKTDTQLKKIISEIWQLSSHMPFKKLARMTLACTRRFQIRIWRTLAFIEADFTTGSNEGLFPTFYARSPLDMILKTVPDA